LLVESTKNASTAYTFGREAINPRICNKSTGKKRKAKKYGAVSSRKNSSFVRVIALYHGLFQLFAMFYGSGEGNFNHDLR
jgi:hypothetical protein